jgi:CxxC motif-containing protein (DUF1111 family)
MSVRIAGSNAPELAPASELELAPAHLPPPAYARAPAPPPARALVASLLAVAALAGCSEARDDAYGSRGAPPEFRDLDALWAIGDPLPGLTDEELGRFIEGRSLFRRIFTDADGLGPLFNENSCNACHTDPADGGTGDQFMIRAAAIHPDGSCDPLTAVGGDNLRQRVIAHAAAMGVGRDEVPAAATVTARFNVPFLFGLGLVEAIPDEVLLARAHDRERDPVRRGSAIRGRAPLTADGRVARFGRKGDHATLDSFTEEALRLEMGIGTPSYPEALGSNRGALPEGLNLPAGPHVTQDQMDRITDFVRYLAPSPRAWPDDPAARALIVEGERLFDAVGCTGCHTPWMETGPHPVAALDRTRVYLYSDLLLHDLGDELANVCSERAGARELRTQPLMGLHHRRRFLHDGRAVSVWDAIAAHGGEAREVRERFDRLSRAEQEALTRFLASL